MKSKLIALISVFLLWPLRPAAAFNLITDIQTQTQWTLGQVASAGTSVDLKNGQYDVSEFAEIANYRMLSGWYGGIEIPQGDGTVKLTDSAKIGLNLGYFLKSFVNQPPMILQNLVVGPAIGFNLVSSPRTVHYFVDLNYRFSGLTGPPPPSISPTPLPTIPKL